MNELPGHWPALLVVAMGALTIAAWVGMSIEHFRPVRKCLSEKSPDRMGPYLTLCACLLVGNPATVSWLVALPTGAPTVTKISFAIAACACAVGIAAAFEALRGTWAAGRKAA